MTKLCLEDLTDKIVPDFLEDGERVRRGSIGTRNCRLAALRAFFAFLAARDPSALAQCSAVLHIPAKRAARPALCYLDANEVEASSLNLIAARLPVSATMRCYRSCTTPARGFKKHSMCAQTPFDLPHRQRYASLAKVAKSAFVPCGPRPFSFCEHS